jgi:hypothetical protein
MTDSSGAETQRPIGSVAHLLVFAAITFGVGNLDEMPTLGQIKPSGASAAANRHRELGSHLKDAKAVQFCSRCLRTVKPALTM